MGALDTLRSRKVLRRFHSAATVFWIVMGPVAALTDLKNSTAFLVYISIWALVTGHWSSWQGVRAEEEASKS